ncbi:hypothetical protein [Hyphococcus sp.]|uniref:hypothetical protein n=1 Tax=Hyphococcus sp. TaxID=2038636 RepID=UPI00208780B1|nr:MAG: hypothetical protein DHS20C04_31840 [Marinicaulis sp.]
MALAAQGSFEPMGFGFWNSLVMSGGGFFVFLFIGLMIVVHVGFALGVYRDATSRPEGPDLATPAIWALATLLGGVVTAIIYWAVHYSTFKAQRP